MKVLLNNIYTTTEEDVETGTCDLCLSYDDWDVAVFSFTFEGRNYDIEGWCKGKYNDMYVVDAPENPMNFAGWLTEREFTEDELDFTLLIDGGRDDYYIPYRYYWLENVLRLYRKDIADGAWD